MARRRTRWRFTVGSLTAELFVPCQLHVIVLFSGTKLQLTCQLSTAKSRVACQPHVKGHSISAVKRHLGSARAWVRVRVPSPADARAHVARRREGRVERRQHHHESTCEPRRGECAWLIIGSSRPSGGLGCARGCLEWVKSRRHSSIQLSPRTHFILLDLAPAHLQPL